MLIVQPTNNGRARAHQPSPGVSIACNVAAAKNWVVTVEETSFFLFVCCVF